MFFMVLKVVFSWFSSGPDKSPKELFFLCRNTIATCLVTFQQLSPSSHGPFRTGPKTTHFWALFGDPIFRMFWKDPIFWMHDFLWSFWNLGYGDMHKIYPSSSIWNTTYARFELSGWFVHPVAVLMGLKAHTPVGCVRRGPSPDTSHDHFVTWYDY